MTAPATPHAYTLPELPYDYAALEPHTSATLLQLHHDKHHAAYVKGANETLERLASAEAWQLPGLEQSLAFHVGGHLLHSTFWQSLTPDTGQRPEGDLLDAITDQFGSFDAFKQRFTMALTTIQGSGWAVLGWEPTAERLMIVQVKDHHGAHVVGSQPVLVADGWEHAFYLDYRNDKDKWAAAFFEMADWKRAGERFGQAQLGR